MDIFPFGNFALLFKGDIKEFVQLLFWRISLDYAFTGNKRYTIQLLEKGFKVKEVQGGTIEEARQKLGIALPVLES